jgi:putative flippase GtrA
MSALVGRYRAFRSSPHFARIWKFAAVSVVSTIVSQSLLFAFYPHVVGSAMGSNVIATSISTVPAYYLNRRWTWGKRGRSHLWKEVVPFWVLAFVGLVVSTLIVGIAATNADRVSSSAEFRNVVVHLANLFAYGIIWVARYAILNKFLFGPDTQHRGPAVAGNGVAGNGVAGNGVAGKQSPLPIAGAGSVEPVLLPIERTS